MMKPASARNFDADVFGKSLTSFDIWGEDDDGAFDESLVSNSSFEQDLKDDWTIATEETTNSTGRSSLHSCSTSGSDSKSASGRQRSSRRESGKSKDGTKRSSSSKNKKSLNDLFATDMGKSMADLIAVIGDEGEKSIMSMLSDEEGRSVKTSQSERSHGERKENKENGSLDDTRVETSRRQVSRTSSGSAKRSSDPNRGVKKTTSMPQPPRRRRPKTGAIQEEGEEEEVVARKGPPKRCVSMIAQPSRPASMRQLASLESQEGSTRGVARNTSMEACRTSRRPSSSRQLTVNRESHEEDESSASPPQRHVGRCSSMSEQRPRKPQSMRCMKTSNEDEDGIGQRPRKPQSMRFPKIATTKEDEDDTEQRPNGTSRRGVDRRASMQGSEQRPGRRASTSMDGRQRSIRHLRDCAEQTTDGKEQWPRRRIARGASFKANNGIM